jgi:putative FmdB family regulatory protein
MPIYAYRCGACGLARDVLQKFSDPVLTVCPECGAEAFSKQVTAAGFQLKGSGWYVTDFRDGGNKAKSSDSGDSTKAEPSTEKSTEAAPAATTAPAAASAASAPAASAPAPAASPAPATAKSQD